LGQSHQQIHNQESFWLCLDKQFDPKNSNRVRSNWDFNTTQTLQKFSNSEQTKFSLSKDKWCHWSLTARDGVKRANARKMVLAMRAVLLWKKNHAQQILGRQSFQSEFKSRNHEHSADQQMMSKKLRNLGEAVPFQISLITFWRVLFVQIAMWF
jgi:isochorismate synthase EntC